MNRITKSLMSSYTGTKDTYFNNTVLLLNGDNSSSSSQNNTFIDSSANNISLVRSGTPSQGSFNPYGKNWSNYFDGTGDYLSIPTNTAFNFSTGDFTVECYANLNVIGGLLVTAVDGTGGLFFGFQTSTLFGYGRTGVAWDYVATVSLSLRQWYHFAITRSGTSIRLFIDGQQVGATQTSSVAYNLGATNLLIGGFATSFYVDGYISNVRVLKGVAQYTTNFTPANKPLEAIGGTSLLACQSNRFKDSSANNFSITPAGNTSVQVYSPFISDRAYYAVNNGGSSYFDGTGDYLNTASISQLNPGSGIFTWECWFYPTATWDQTSLGGDILFYNNVSGGLQIGRASTVIGNSWGVASAQVAWRLTSTTLPVINQWNHMAVSRSGIGATQTALFLNGQRIAQGAVTDTFVQGATYIMDSPVVNDTESTGYISDMRLVVGSVVYDPSLTTYTVPYAPLNVIDNTQLLLKFTNAGVVDKSSHILVETIGSAQVDNIIKKNNTGSIYLNGVSSYLQVNDSRDLVLGSSDFTIEAWVYPTAMPFGLIDYRALGGAGTNLYIYYAAGLLSLFVQPSNIISASVPSLLNKWNHIAVTRFAGTSKLFLDGTQIGSSFADSNVYTCGAFRPVIGVNGNSLGDNLNGYIDDFRITKGVARYTSNFSPPARALPER